VTEARTWKIEEEQSRMPVLATRPYPRLSEAQMDRVLREVAQYFAALETIQPVREARNTAAWAEILSG